MQFPVELEFRRGQFVTNRHSKSFVKDTACKEYAGFYWHECLACIKVLLHLM